MFRCLKPQCERGKETGCLKGKTLVSCTSGNLPFPGRNSICVEGVHSKGTPALKRNKSASHHLQGPKVLLALQEPRLFPTIITAQGCQMVCWARRVAIPAGDSGKLGSGGACFCSILG